MKASPRRKAAKVTKKKAVAKKSSAVKKKVLAKKRAAPKKKAAAKKRAAPKKKAAAKKRATASKAAVKSGPVVLDSRPCIKTVGELRKSLLAAQNAGSTVVVDASGVESIDTAALQLLLAFANSMRAKSQSLEWQKPSGVFCEMADLLDLTESMGIGNGSLATEDDGLLPVF